MLINMAQDKEYEKAGIPHERRHQKTILLGQLPYEFLAWRAFQSKGNTKDRTLKNYKRIAEYWLDHLGNIPIGEIKRADVSEILQDKKTMPRRGEIVVGDYSYHKVFDRAVERASIEARPERLTFHGLRHTYATGKLMDGTDMRTLAYLLGHKTLAMVMRYAHPDLERARGMPRLEHKAGGMITLRSPNENAEEEKSMLIKLCRDKIAGLIIRWFQVQVLAGPIDWPEKFR